MENVIERKKQKGKLFFLTLIIVSGIAVFSLLFLAFEGDRVTSYTIERFVLDQGIVEREIAPDVPSEVRAQFISDLHRFFSQARSGNESKEKVASVGGKLKEIMADQVISSDEIRALERLIQE